MSVVIVYSLYTFHDWIVDRVPHIPVSSHKFICGTCSVVGTPAVIWCGSCLLPIVIMLFYFGMWVMLMALLSSVPQTCVEIISLR